VAIATAGVIPLFAAPAGAANTCNGVGVAGGEFPNTPGAQSQWKIDCTTNAGTKVDNIVVADAGNAYWHRGAARSVTVTPTAGPSANITFAASAITASDLRRPISGGCIAGGAFIRTIVSTTVATLSKANGTTGCAAVSATVEHTNSRVLQDASCTASPAGVITSASGVFTATDIGKSVSGGPFKIGSRISAVTATTATVKLAASGAPGNAACTAPDTITIGAATYTPSTAAAPAWNTDPMSVDMTNSAANGQAFSCVGSVMTETAAAIAAGQNFSTAYAKLPVVFKVGAITTVRSVLSASTTAFTLNAACPAGVTATAGEVAIGKPGANAPKTGNSFASLSAELNLNPVLVATQDDCSLNTFEGFQVIGTWNNPMNSLGTLSGYTTTAVLGAPVLVSTGQVLYPTAVVSFAAYIRPQRTGGLAGGLPAGSHFEFVFPSLPTTLAVCLTAGNPANGTALAFGLAPTTLSTSPALPTASGNPADPGIRAIGPQTGATHGQYTLKNGAAVVVANSALPTCTIPLNTAVPAFGCGDG